MGIYFSIFFFDHLDSFLRYKGKQGALAHFYRHAAHFEHHAANFLPPCNVKAYVASDIISDSTYIPAENLNSQKYPININESTDKQKMKINAEKTKQMIFNFTNDFQFSTRNNINGKNIEVIDKVKRLGVVLTNDLK